jgi:ribosomal protein L19
MIKHLHSFDTSLNKEIKFMIVTPCRNIEVLKNGTLRTKKLNYICDLNLIKTKLKSELFKYYIV